MVKYDLEYQLVHYFQMGHFNLTVFNWYCNVFVPRFVLLRGQLFVGKRMVKVIGHHSTINNNKKTIKRRKK